ncbi:hypothetical protein N2152v2_009521 [Parachlorella kessleri]
MGNTTSQVEQEATSTPQPQGGGIKLFKYMKGSGQGGWEVVSSAADLDLYDENEDATSKGPCWHLTVEGGQDTISAEVDEQFSFEPKENRVTFVSGEDVWALRFPNSKAFDAFLQKFNAALFENTFGEDRSKADKIMGDGPMRFDGLETDESRQHWVEDMDVEDKPNAKELRTPLRDKVVGKRQSIHGVVMGAGDRSYVVRDNEIDVMRNVMGGVEDTGFSFQVTPAKKSSLKSFTPSKALLMGHETKMNMISPLASTSLFHTDIETGKVISEWNFQKDGADIPIKDIVSDNKAAQLEERSTFLGLDSNRLARWDLRDPHGVVQEMASPIVSYVGGKDYARGTKFNCMATSGDGFVVVGSDDGKVRLYSEKTLTQAKTAIPGLGLPITNVDVSYDGKWVLATTKSYLMVVKTTYRDPKTGKELCGFTNRMGPNAPAPRLLRLKPQDTALTANAPLEKGHFTWITEKGRQERWIVASCGNYTVLWNFRQVKLAQPEVVSYGALTTVTNYHLIPKSEHVVDSVFMHDNYARTPTGAEETSMLVVTKNAIYTVADEDE